MSLFDTIIGRRQLQSLPPEMQDQARSEARREFIINSLLGGRGLASGFEGARQVVPQMQQGLQAQRMEQARQQAMVPTGRFTGPQQGSQLGLLRAQMGGDTGVASMLEDPQADAMTTQSLIRGGQGTGIAGTGLTQERQLIPEMELDPTRFAELAAQAMPATQIDNILQNFERVRPKINEQGVMTDLRGRVIGSIPTFKDGIQSQFDAQRGSFVAGAVPGFRQAAEESRPIDLAQGEVIIGRDFQGNPIVRNAQGVIEARLERETATALGGAAGQVERVFDPVSETERLVPRTAVVGGMGAGGMGAGGVGGFATGPSIPQDVRTRSQGAAFETRVKTINEKGQDAGQRAFQANELYNTVSAIDPTALTAVGATIVPYLRAIPGFRDVTDNFATNTALLGQQYARGALGNFAMVKGNLNAQEVRLVENATWQKWDPRTATRYIAALEAAFADKDASQMEFANTYQGDFREYDSAWRNSPQNQSVFNHPMMTRFVNDEVREAVSRGVEPNLPPGFKAEISRSTGRVRITKPDGTTTMVE